MAKNYRTLHRKVLVRKVSSLNDALAERLAVPIPVGRDPELHALSIEGHRSLIADLEVELSAMGPD